MQGWFTSQRWIPLTKASDTELWYFFDLRLNKPLSKLNNQHVGDLRRHHAHYDVTLMIFSNTTLKFNAVDHVSLA